MTMPTPPRIDLTEGECVREDRVIPGGAPEGLSAADGSRRIYPGNETFFFAIGGVANGAYLLLQRNIP